MEKSNRKPLEKTQKKVIIIMVVAGIVAALIFAGVSYVRDYYKATSTAQKAMLGNELVEVSEYETYYHFSLREKEAARGIIFYPGGKVEETAYAPLLLEITELGYEVFLVKMPVKLAMFGMNRADVVIEANPDVDEWIMAGHSLGGAIAASYSASHDDEIDGLVLLAAYSMEDLSDKEIDVFSIYGSEDGVLNMDNYQKYYENLPDDMIEIVIDGGNHAYFGYYGEQDGDGTASISRDEQIQTVLDHFVYAW